MAYVEKIGGLFHNLCHISYLNLDLDAPVDAPGQGFHRLKVSNWHKHLGMHFSNGYHASN